MRQFNMCIASRSSYFGDSHSIGVWIKNGDRLGDGGVHRKAVSSVRRQPVRVRHTVSLDLEFIIYFKIFDFFPASALQC